METMTNRPRSSGIAQSTLDQPRIKTQGTAHQPGAYHRDKFGTPIKRQIGRTKTSPSQLLRYEPPQQYIKAGTPGGVPGAPDDDDQDDDYADDQDNQEDKENFKDGEEHEEQNHYDYNEVEEIIPDWKGKLWKSMFYTQMLTNMQPITKKPNIQSPELCTIDAKCSEANELDTYAMDILDYLIVYHIRPENDEGLPYASGYLSELAKEFMSTWRNDPLNENKKLRSFLNNCKWGSGLLKSHLCFLTSKKHKQDYKQRETTTWG